MPTQRQINKYKKAYAQLNPATRPLNTKAEATREAAERYEADLDYLEEIVEKMSNFEVDNPFWPSALGRIVNARNRAIDRIPYSQEEKARYLEILMLEVSDLIESELVDAGRRQAEPNQDGKYVKLRIP